MRAGILTDSRPSGLAIYRDGKVYLGPLVGMKEIAEMLGKAEQTVRVWRHRGMMPDADLVISRTPLWSRNRIEAWARETGRLT